MFPSHQPAVGLVEPFMEAAGIEPAQDSPGEPVFVGRWNNLSQLNERTRLEQAIERRDGDGCFYCGDTATRTVDHVLARVHGGSDRLDNLVFACRSCNWMKLDSPGWLWALWVPVFGQVRVAPTVLRRSYARRAAEWAALTAEAKQ